MSYTHNNLLLQNRIKFRFFLYEILSCLGIKERAEGFNLIPFAF